MTVSAYIYIAACLIVAGLDVYIGLKVWDMYFSQPTNLTEDVEDEYGDDQ